MLKNKLSYSTTPLGSIYVAADVKCCCKIHFRHYKESHNCWQSHVCEFWGFCTRVAVDFVPPGYDASSMGSPILMFRRNVLITIFKGHFFILLQPTDMWRWRQSVPSKCQYSTSLWWSTISQKNGIFCAMFEVCQQL